LELTKRTEKLERDVRTPGSTNANKGKIYYVRIPAAIPEKEYAGLFDTWKVPRHHFLIYIANH
jgi:hypothetical protein